MGSEAAKTLKHPNRDAGSRVAGAPTCPKELGAVAQKKWKQIVKLMKDAGTITKFDADALESYCEAYERRKAALAFLGTDYTLEGDKGSYQNPLLHVANKALDQMIKLSKILGIDKLTAKKLGVDGKPPAQRGVSARDRTKGPPPPGGNA